MRSRLPIVLCLLVVAVSAWAVDPTRHISQYAHRAWTIRDGYFGGQLEAVAQAADGYLWVGTRSGLLRFDGVRFTPFTAPIGQRLPSPRIWSLHAGHDGSLWIGTSSGLSHWINQNLINLDVKGAIGNIVEDPSGTTWVIHGPVEDAYEPLCRVIETTVRCYGTADGVPLRAGGDLALDAAGNLWIANENSIVRWQPDSSTVYALSALKSLEGVDGVEAISIHPDGSVLAGMAMPGRGLGLQQLIGGVWKPFERPGLDGTGLTVATLFVDRQGALWIGTLQQGMYRVHGQRVEHFGKADGLSSDYVRKFYEDREGDLWVVTSQGLDVFHDLRVVTFSTREGLGTEEVDSVLASRDGTVWIGGAESLDALRKNGVTSVKTGKGLPGSQVGALFEDHAGQLWVGIDQTLSIYEKGRFRPIDRSDGSAIGEITGITEDRDNNIWAAVWHASVRRLLRIHDFKIEQEFPAPKMPAARIVVAGPDGSLWFGLLSGDLARVRDGRSEVFHFERTQDSRVEQLMLGRDGSVLGATAFGVIGWKSGKQQILTVRNGLPCDSVQGLIVDAHDNLWLNTQCGIVEVADAELQKWWSQSDIDVHPRVFDVFDGAQPGSTYWAAAVRAADGRLWFGNGSVLQMIDPANLNRNAVPPPVHVEEIIADRKRYSPQDGLRIPPLPRDLEIDYTALSFAVPQKVLFRYKLEGHESNWQEPGTRRQAFYTDLRPGQYRFRVIASNEDGVWNEIGATLDFSVAPAWYQTSWFVIGCALTGLLAIWTIYRVRVQQVAGRLSARFDERLAERTRIARDLHDTLLQTIQGSKLVLEDALEQPGDSARMRRAVEQLSIWLQRAVQEGRAALDSLRASSATTNDLSDALRRTTEERRIEGRMNVSFSMIGGPRELHPLVRDEVYQIADEAIRNAWAHSRGKRLEVELRYAQDLAVRVRDDGVGMDVSVVDQGKKGHFGLQGMRERADRIGGRLTVLTSASSGAEITIVVPGNLAFRKPQKTTLGSRKSIFRLRRRTSDPGTSRLDLQQEE